MLNPMDEANKTIQCLQDQVERLEAKVQRLQTSKLDKAAMAVMQGFCALGVNTDHEGARRSAELAVFQVKALLAEIDKEGEG